MTINKNTDKYIKEYYLDVARYKAVNYSGETIWLEIDYWNNNFKISSKNKILENLAKRLLKDKHKVNFSQKLNIAVPKSGRIQK